MKKETICLLLTSIALLTIAPVGAKKAAGPDGAAIFKQQCASCHAGGGNEVKPGKPVAGSSKLSTLGVFKDYLSAPPGHMPYYENIVKDQKVLTALWKYCRSLKPPKQA